MVIRIVRRLVLVQPLIDDHVVHEAKGAKHEHHLRKELAEKVEGVPKVNSICTFHKDAENHVDHTYNHR